MKKYLLLSASLLIAWPLIAQNAINVSPNWAESKAGFTIGGDIEMPHGLDYEYLLKTGQDVDFDASELDLSEGELTDMQCDNGTFRFSVSLMPPGSMNTEWQFSFLSIDGRIDKVYYELDDDQFLEVSAENKETAVEAVFLKSSQSGSLSFYAGAGTNIGISHGGKVHVKGMLKDDPVSDVPATIEEFEYTYDQENSLNQRLFLQAGMGVRVFNALEVGFDLRKGLGYRASFDGPFKFTTLKRSIGLNLKLLL